MLKGDVIITYEKLVPRLTVLLSVEKHLHDKASFYGVYKQMFFYWGGLSFYFNVIIACEDVY